MTVDIMLMIYMILAFVVIAFLVMICLVLFRIERTVRMTMMFAEKKILADYGYGQAQPIDLSKK